MSAGTATFDMPGLRLSLVAGLSHPARALDTSSLVRELVRSGDDDLFDELVGRFKNKVFRLAVSVLGPGREPEAEDVTQEVFLVAYRKIHTFRHDSEFSTWLYRLTRNRAIDSLRKARMRYPHVGDEELQWMPDTKPAGNPEAVTAAGQRRNELLRHVQALPERQRSVVLLFYWMDTAVAEIAELMDMNAQTVKSHLHRARKRLARALQAED